MRPWTDRQTHTHTHTQRETRVITIHFASSTTHAKCKKGQHRPFETRADVFASLYKVRLFVSVIRQLNRAFAIAWRLSVVLRVLSFMLVVTQVLYTARGELSIEQVWRSGVLSHRVVS